MSGVTNELIKKSRHISNNFSGASMMYSYHLVSKGMLLIAEDLFTKASKLDLGYHGKFQFLQKTHIKIQE